MNNQERKEFTLELKNLALKEGFDACGIARANYLPDEKDHLLNWLEQHYQGEMGYMEKNVDKRTDPRLLVKNAKSVISLLLNYYPEEELPEANNYRISKYAYGRDYHKVIKSKLKSIINLLQEKAGSDNIRGFTDSAPVLDRSWAKRSGLGWIGKNTCLINVMGGSFYFIAEVITDIELDYDKPFEKDFCGGCTKCIEACPTNAIVAPYILDSRRCISYLTIENHREIPQAYKNHMENWIFGCDICQDVCPWNRIARPHKVPQFQPSDSLKTMNREKWENLTNDQFDELFEGSAVRRTKFEGLTRNINYIKSK